MFDPHQPVTLVTVTHPICGAFLERFPPVLKYFTNPLQVHKQFVVINHGLVEDPRFAQRVQENFDALPWPVEFVDTHQNRWDLPACNDLRELIPTDYWVMVSPDTRLMTPDWLDDFMGAFTDETVALVGPEGPARGLTPQRAREDPDWGWIGRLLLDRGLDFDETRHVQTWCFAMQQRAFREVGGFWEREGGAEGKGDVITAEIYLSVALRSRGWSVVYHTPPLHHYGTKGGTVQIAELDDFDRQMGFPTFG